VDLAICSQSPACFRNSSRGFIGLVLEKGPGQPTNFHCSSLFLRKEKAPGAGLGLGIVTRQVDVVSEASLTVTPPFASWATPLVLLQPARRIRAIASGTSLCFAARLELEGLDVRASDYEMARR
jgi:hypothetical protein